jgi:hypothetical protein
MLPQGTCPPKVRSDSQARRVPGLARGVASLRAVGLLLAGLLIVAPWSLRFPEASGSEVSLAEDASWSQQLVASAQVKRSARAARKSQGSSQVCSHAGLGGSQAAAMARDGRPGTQAYRLPLRC